MPVDALGAVTDATRAPTFELAHSRRRERRFASRLVALAVALVPFACGAGIWLERLLANSGGAKLAALMVMASPLLLVVAAWRRSALRDAAFDRARVDATGLTLSGPRGASHTIARTDAANGALVPGAAPSVRITTHANDELVLTPRDPGAAARLLEALGLDAARQRFSIRTRRAFHRILLWLFTPSVAMAGGRLGVVASDALGLGPGATPFAALAGLAAAAALLAWMHRTLITTTVTVGTDAIVVRRAFGTETHPLAGLARVEAGAPSRVRLTYDDGARASFRFAPDDPTETAVLVARIGEAIAQRDAAPEASSRALADDALARRGRTFGQWNAALATVLERADDYRTASLSRDELRTLVSDASAPIERRIAAVVALAHARDESLSERVRVAVESTAVPRLRVALERAADGSLDESTLESAVEEERALAKTGE